VAAFPGIARRHDRVAPHRPGGLPSGVSQPSDEIASFRTLDNRVFGVVDRERDGGTYGWTLLQQISQAGAATYEIIDIAGALPSSEAAVKSLHAAMLCHQTGEV
jgi:hypothetical protein